MFLERMHGMLRLLKMAEKAGFVKRFFATTDQFPKYRGQAARQN
jgi:hypothetical protein